MRYIIYILFSCLLFISCKKKVDSVPTNPTTTPTTTHHYFKDTSISLTGRDTTKPNNLEPTLYVEDLDPLSIPPFGRIMSPTTWTINVPPPGSQKFNDCIGWALGYGLLGYQFKVIEQSPDYNGTNRIFSPAYIYNQLNGGANGGINIYYAFNLIKQQGCCKWAYMPGDLSYTTLPSADAKQNASNYKIANYYEFKKPIDINRVKYYLSLNYPLPFGILIDEGFKTGDGCDIKDNRDVWNHAYGRSIGYHEMLLCGYDDNINAFKVLNSWGRNWGDDGYLWVDYDYFKQTVYDVDLVLPKKCSDNLSANILGTWTGTWTGYSYAKNYPTLPVTDSTIVGGTWAVDIQRINLKDSGAVGTVTWSGIDAYWTYTAIPGNSYNNPLQHPFIANRTKSFDSSMTKLVWLNWTSGCILYLKIDLIKNQPNPSDGFYGPRLELYMDVNTKKIIKVDRSWAAHPYDPSNFTTFFSAGELEGGK